MKKLFAGLFMMSVVFFAAAQKTIINDANAEKRNVPAFTGIKVSHAIDIYLTQGDEDGIAVRAGHHCAAPIRDTSGRKKCRCAAIRWTLNARAPGHPGSPAAAAHLPAMPSAAPHSPA